MGKILGVIYDFTFVHPYRLMSRSSARTDCRGGSGEAGQPLGRGVFG